jgi:hypothetical protein
MARGLDLRSSLLAAWLIGCSIVSVAQADPEPDDPSVPSDPVFMGLKTDGETVLGRIVAISVDRITMETLEKTRKDVPLRSLVKLSRQPKPAPQAPGGSHHVVLADGDRLVQATVTGTTETAIEVQSHSSLGKLKVPLDAVLGLILSPPTDADAFDELWDRVRTEPRTTEVVWLANGDRLTGGFLGLDERAVKLQVEGKEVELDRTGVVAVGFDPAVLNYPRPGGGFLELGFTDGSRLAVTGAEVARGEIRAATRFGQKIQVPICELLCINSRTDAVVPLTERKPDGETYVSYVGPTRPYRADLTVDGHRFQLGGQTYERGIGTQSRTLLAYRLKPGDRRFQALVGVDDRAGPLGSVVFRVVLDGRPALVTRSMGAKDPPRAIDLDVSQSRVLILITEFGDRGDVRDLADWVEARLIR